MECMEARLASKKGQADNLKGNDDSPASARVALRIYCCKNRATPRGFLRKEGGRERNCARGQALNSTAG